MSPADRAVIAARLFACDPAGFAGLVLRGRSGPARDALVGVIQAARPAAAPWKRAPINVDDERLIGGLDLPATLSAGAPVFRPGLLAQADGGVLVLASAERLSPGVAGRIAAAIDNAGVQFERDGGSAFWPSRFGFVALDEGEDDEGAPPVLMERAALLVDVPDRVALDTAALDQPAPIAPSMVEDADIEALCAAAAALGAASLRAPMQAVRAAGWLAALNARARANADDVALAAALVLAPRATQPPQLQDQDPPAPPDDPLPDDPSTNESPPPSTQPDLADLVIAAARAALPERLLAALSEGAAKKGASGQGVRRGSVLRGRPLPARAGLPRNGARLALLETLKAAAPWRRLRAAPVDGRRLSITRDDLRIKRFAERSETSVVFIVDASGSAAFQRLAEVKGAIEMILSQAYATRTHVALVAFRQDGAQVLTPPTRSLARARARLSALPGGGATPLAAGLEAGFSLALAERGKGRSVLALVLSDGRANVAADGARDRRRASDDAHAAAQRFRAHGIPAVFVDTGRWPAPENAALAQAMGARYAPLPFADAAAVKALAGA